jgi:biotin carboxylase
MIAVLETQIFGLGRLVAAAEQAGERLCLLTGNRGLYAHELTRLDPGALDVVDVDTRDAAACVAAIKALPDVRGLVNPTDTWMLPGAEVAAQLGLPGPDPAAVRVLRDKLAVRNLLHANGLSQSSAVPADQTIELPAVLKDSAGTSSRNVWIVRDRTERDAALAEAAGRPLFGRLLAEPFLPGPLYSAETLTWAGRTRLLGVTSRLTSSVREQAAALPVVLPERAALAEWVGRVLAAAGHTQGFAHVELVLTTEGPEVVEVNARIGGALVGEALCRSLDVNVYEALIDMALDRPPALLDAEFDGGPAVGFALVYPDRTGTFTGVCGLDRLAAYPGDPEWYPTMATGTQVVHLDDQRACTGILLAEAATAELALHRALAACGSLRPTMR